MTPRRVAVAVALVLVSGCPRSDFVAEQQVSGSPGTPAPDPTNPATTIPTPDPTNPVTPTPTPDPTNPATTTPTPSACPWTGAPFLADGTCTGTLAQRVFARAACACGAATLGADLVTDGFDSRVAPWSAGGAGGDVGAITGLTSSTLLDIGGSLAVSGAGADAGRTLRVAGDLAVAGPLGQTSSAVTVGGAASIAGDVGVSSLTVAGTLTTPPGAALAGTIRAGSRVTGAVSVAPACPCGAGDAVDVATIVAGHQATNDDASIGLAPSALAGVGGSATLELPCGRFYLDQIQGAAYVTIRATGSAALFVGGALALAGGLSIELASGAELDLFVAGPVNLPVTVRLGDPARPRALRLWLATNDVRVPYGAQIAANVYAPRATFASTTPLELYGAVMAGALSTSAPLTIHRDRAVGAAAATCGP